MEPAKKIQPQWQASPKCRTQAREQAKKIQEEGRKNLSNGSKKIQPQTHGFQTAKITRISS